MEGRVYVVAGDGGERGGAGGAGRHGVVAGAGEEHQAEFGGECVYAVGGGGGAVMTICSRPPASCVGKQKSGRASSRTDAPWTQQFG